MEPLATPRIELTRQAARDLDRAAQDRFGIPGIVLMENAARGTADVARAMLAVSRGQPIPSRIVVVCGAGNNGGDGYAAARHLANAGHRVELVPLSTPRADGDAATNARICQRMGLACVSIESLGTAPALVIDAIFGTGLDRPVHGIELQAIGVINRCGAPILSIDLPSGIDNDAAMPFGASVRATVTAVTVAPRPAMRLPPASGQFGRVVIVDIGSPSQLLSEFGRRVDVG